MRWQEKHQGGQQVENMGHGHFLLLLRTRSETEEGAWGGCTARPPGPGRGLPTAVAWPPQRQTKIPSFTSPTPRWDQISPPCYATRPPLLLPSCPS
jgi:hypothetical protein